MSGSGRVGLELELLAAPGRTRFDVAAAVARAANARSAGLDHFVHYGLKHVVEGVMPDGRASCSLSVAAVVVDHSERRQLCSVVDDNTIRDHAAAAAGDASDGVPRVLADDARLSKWLESKARAPTPDIVELCAPLLETFDGRIEERGHRQRLDGIVDRWGQVLALVADEPAAHWRVCEIVTAPLAPAERDDVVRLLLDTAAREGCTVPAEAALHVHVDAEPWRDGRKLCALIRNWNARRDEIARRLRPNPRCRKLGAFPDDVARVARECPPDLPFASLAAALAMAGAKKELDVNLLGVIQRYPVQPTLEVRCLPMSLDARDVLASVDDAVALLDELARS